MNKMHSNEAIDLLNQFLIPTDKEMVELYINEKRLIVGYEDDDWYVDEIDLWNFIFEKVPGLLLLEDENEAITIAFNHEVGKKLKRERKRLASKEEEYRKIEEKNKDLKKKVDRLKEENRELDHENRMLTLTNRNLNKSISELRRDTSRKTVEKNEMLERKVKRLNQQIELLMDEPAPNSRKENELLSKQVKELNEQIEFITFAFKALAEPKGKDQYEVNNYQS